VKPVSRLPATARIPHVGDERKLWITDYPTALPELILADRTSAEGQTGKGTAH
jgi:hypothetical protein